MYKLFTDSAGFEHGNLCQWDFAPLLTVGVGLHPPVTFQDAVQLSSSILVYHTKEARPLSAVMSVAQKMVWRVDRVLSVSVANSINIYCPNFLCLRRRGKSAMRHRNLESTRARCGSSIFMERKEQSMFHVSILFSETVFQPEMLTPFLSMDAAWSVESHGTGVPQYGVARYGCPTVQLCHDTGVPRYRGPTVQRLHLGWIQNGSLHMRTCLCYPLFLFGKSGNQPGLIQELSV
ncbi:uncharacterized protein [Narcine bancroftii]